MKVCRKTAGCLEMFHFRHQLRWFWKRFEWCFRGLGAEFLIKIRRRILDIFGLAFGCFGAGNGRFWVNGVGNGF